MASPVAPPPAVDLETALQSLTPCEALVLRLTYIESMNRAEIARHVLLPEPTVTRMLSRALIKLGDLLCPRPALSRPVGRSG